AEVVELLKIPVRAVPELRAAAVTDGLVRAHLALGMKDGLLRGEAVAPRAAGDFAPGIGHDVSEVPVALYEKNARKHVAVIFHDRIAIARFKQLATSGTLPGESFCHVVEEADANLATLGPPEIE